MPLQPARLELNPDGTPYSAQYGDIYHSAAGGPAQARHVFLAGNDLPARWQGQERFVILETGFGLGLNFLATWQAWRADPQRCRRLHFVSIEKHPFTAADLAVAQQAWPEFADLAVSLRQHWPPLTPGIHRLHLDDDRVILTIVFGDAATRLREIDAAVDAFFLDAFAPATNPEPWSLPVCKALGRLAAPGATLATWCLARTARDALAAVEFDLERRPGLAPRREMLVGRFRSRRPDRHPLPGERRAIVIGAGVAGSTVAHRLAAAGWQVTVLEQEAAPGQGASGNLAGMFRPLPSADDNRIARLTRAGYLATRALLQGLPDTRWSPCGVLHLARDAEHEAQQRRTVAALGLPPEVVQFLDAAAASALLDWPVDGGGWWFPLAGWVQPPALCRAALAAFPERITARYAVAVDRLLRAKTNWQALAADGRVLAEAPVVVMASGVAAPRFSQFAWLPQIAARGQVSHLPAAATPPLAIVVSRRAYAIPAVDGYCLTGATLAYDDDEMTERRADHRENMAQLDLTLPGFAAAIDPDELTGRVGFRPLSPDRLPIVGAVPAASAAGSNGRLHSLPRLPGLWCVQGFGARGITWSALMADLLVSRLEGDPLPLERDLVDALDPGRFLIRGARHAEPAAKTDLCQPLIL
jgi:tRNA 5-methylaminomethyl-2-thiouridine biosynthesis bifunctional protein